jgi:ribosome recycling factor
VEASGGLWRGAASVWGPLPAVEGSRGYSKKSKASRVAENEDSGDGEGQFDLEQYQGMMSKTIEHFQHELANIRMGRATPGMLDHLKVEAYGEKLPMKAVGTVSVKTPQLLAVTVFDTTLAGSVASCISSSPLALNPQVDGQEVLVPIPPPTHETIEAMKKLCKSEAEAAKVSIRNARKLAKDATRSIQCKDEKFSAEKTIQKLTDDYIGEVEKILKQKAEDIGEI